MINDKNNNLFKNLGINENLINKLNNLNYKEPFPIQKECIPKILSNKNILGIASTGSGKTLAFILPILDKLYNNKNIKVLIIEPTRELSIQVEKNFKLFINNSISLLCGGQDYYNQIKTLKKKPNIIIGTPGRILDHINKKTLNIYKIDILIIDEADEMLNMGFINDINKITKEINNNYQIILFSATTSDLIYKNFLNNKFKNNYEKIYIESKNDIIPNIEQNYCIINNNYLKENILIRFLEYIKFNLAIIFVNKKYYTVNLSDNLKLANYKICYLNGDMDQKLREKNIEDLKNKKYKILIATDVASRGLDIKDIDLVINYDIPNDINTYIHRIGRTGRAGNYGKSISFILKNEIYLFNKINKKFNNNINKISYPSNIEILELNLNKFIEKIKNNFEDIKNEKVDIKKYKNIIDKLLIFTENNIELLCIILFKIIQNNNYIYNIFSNNNKNNNSKYKMKINIGLQDKIKKYDILKKISEVMFIDINNIYIKLFNNYSILTINTDKNIKNNYNIYINKKIFKIKNLY